MPRFNLGALSDTAIHIADDSAVPVRFAADELQRYLHRMCGARLPIVHAAALHGRAALVLGPPGPWDHAPAPLHPDRYAVVPEDAQITIAGGSPRALLHGVYALLEQCGCRWSLHGPDEETVPHLTGDAIELTPIQHTAPFSARGYCSDIMTWHYTQPEHLHDRLPDDRTFIDWMGKSGANAFFFIRHPFDTQLTIPELLPDFQRRGIDVEYGGHVMPLLLPRELFAQHPDYFPAAPDGQRTDHGNLCTSSPAALATAAANALQYVHDYPEMQVLHIWGADLWQGGWCHCAACQPVSVQDQSLRVCNAVARGLSAAGVPRPVCYLAYHDTIDAQLTESPDEHVVCEFAPRERCYAHALNDSACDTNRRYAAALEGYVEQFAGRVRLFEYYGDAILFFGCAVPLTRVIAADMAYFQGLGIRDILMLQFGTFSTWAYPLNFLRFAAAAQGSRTDNALGAYCTRFGSHAAAAQTAFATLESIMQQVVTYGDIRIRPRASEAAARVLTAIERTIPQLGALAATLHEIDDTALRAQAELVRYTQTVLEGVQHELHTHSSAETIYATALQLMEGIDRRCKGLWGRIDLPIIHSFYTAATYAQ